MSKPILSVCTTMYRQPKCFDAFVRSIAEMATGEDFEVIAVSDRNTAQVEDGMRRLKEEYDFLWVLFPSPDERVHQQLLNCGFYRELYGDKVGSFAETQLQRYQEEEHPLWMQYAWGLNKAAEESRGDFLLLTPGDYVVLTDLHKLAHAVRDYAAIHKGFFGHFSLVAPFVRDLSGTLSDAFGFGGGIPNEYTQVLSHLKSWHLERDEYVVTSPFDRFWPFNHGIRIVDRNAWNLSLGLPGYYLTKTGPTDIFNRVARNLSYGNVKGIAYPPIETLTGVRARMAVVPFDDEEPLEYLYPNHCDGDVVRQMRYKEEAHFKEHHPTWVKFWEKLGGRTSSHS